MTPWDVDIQLQTLCSDMSIQPTPTLTIYRVMFDVFLCADEGAYFSIDERTGDLTLARSAPVRGTKLCVLLQVGVKIYSRCQKLSIGTCVNLSCLLGSMW